MRIVHLPQYLSSHTSCDSDALNTSKTQIMYMEGFKFSTSASEPCLNLFFPDWTLDTSGKFYAACAGVLVLAIVVEGLSALRYRIVRSVKRVHQSPSAELSSSTQALRLVVTLLHGLQGLLGYLLMLAVMTFSVELLLAVVVGLAIGYGAFFQYEEAMGRIHVTTNPCCSFLESEARERQTEEEEEEEEIIIVEEADAEPNDSVRPAESSPEEVSEPAMAEQNA